MVGGGQRHVGLHGHGQRGRGVEGAVVVRGGDGGGGRGQQALRQGGPGVQGPAEAGKVSLEGGVRRER